MIHCTKADTVQLFWFSLSSQVNATSSITASVQAICHELHSDSFQGQHYFAWRTANALIPWS